jgi:hypothetical protein
VECKLLLRGELGGSSRLTVTASTGLSMCRSFSRVAEHFLVTLLSVRAARTTAQRRAHALSLRARLIANRVADFWVSWAARHRVEDSQSGFRLYPAELVRALLSQPPQAKGFAFESEVLIAAAQFGVRTISVSIPSLYGNEMRKSYFRPVLDVTRIVLLVGGKLLARGMDPIGLWRSLQPHDGGSGPRYRP